MAIAPYQVTGTAKDASTLAWCEEGIDSQLEEYRDGEDGYLCDVKTGAVKVTTECVSLSARVIKAIIQRYLDAGWADVQHGIEKLEIWSGGDEDNKVFSQVTEHYFILTPPQPKPLPEPKSQSEKPAPKNPRRGFVYLFKANDLYKIGRSNNPQKRMRKMASAIMPFDIERIHTIGCKNAYAAERELHLMYASKRVKGEWFRLSDEDVQQIKSITVL